MDNRGSLVFFLIAFYLLINTQTRSPLIDQNRGHERGLEKERLALGLLNDSRYGDFEPWSGKWLPFAGLRDNDTYTWDSLPIVQDRARHQLQSIVSSVGFDLPKSHERANTSSPLNTTQLSLPVYHNASSRLRGDWVRREQDRIQPKLNTTAIALEHEYLTHDFTLNITGDSGTFYLDLLDEDGEELRSGNRHVQAVKGGLAVESHSALATSWYMSLYGLHFPESGGLILTTTSEKYDGLLSLPHLALSKDTFELSQELLIKSLSEKLSKQNRPDIVLPWSSLTESELEFPAPKCEHIVYLQQHPVFVEDRLADKSLLQQIEQELRYPTGAPIPSPPNMVLSAVMFSPDCGYVLETKGAPDYPPSESLYLSGMKREQYYRSAARLIYALCAVFCGQITLLLRQIKEACTPSTKSRVSFYTLAMMAFGDALILAFFVLELFSEASFLLLAATSFLVFLSVSYLGMRFMMDVWAVQAPERRERERERLNNTRPPNVRRESLPAPVTAVRDTGATPIILPPDQDAPADEENLPANRGAPQTQGDTRSDIGSMYTRFYFSLLVLFIFSWAFPWANRLGKMYARILGFVYLSFWIPQIYRNVMRNCRKALRWDFVAGQSILRLIPFVYFLTARENILFIRPDWTTVYVMVGWVWIQAWMLASQDVLGPRFFVPNGWAPPAYDYHPLLRDTAESDLDLESGGVLPIGVLRADERDQSESKDQDKQRSRDRKRKVFDCAICMQELEVPVLAASGSAGMADGAISLLSRRAYMVTPCRHIFHSTCLESWMRLRLQCPICRESIPPV